MGNFFLIYQPVFDTFAIEVIFAFSQYIVLRAGVFSIATAGIASIGAYSAAILGTTYGLPWWLCIIVGMLLGALASFVLSIPLARLRGIYQAIATLAFVQIVISLNLYFETVTGGAAGISGIPKAVHTWHLVLVLVVVAYVLSAISSSSIGRAMGAARQDETVAMSLGISITKYHTFAFVLSGALAGLAGGLLAFHSYTIAPSQFGFAMMVAGLTAVVLGGMRTIYGPIFGAAILVLLPEISRPLAQHRYLLHGGMLVILTLYMPNGVIDSTRDILVRMASRRRSKLNEGQG